MTEEVKEEEKKDQGPPEKEFYKQFKLLQHGPMMEAFRKEMSAQVGEMQRWRDYHRNGDPEGMASLYEELFDRVRKAINYRNLYSKRKKELKKNEGEIGKAARAGDVKLIKKLQAERYDIENEMTSIIFRVYRIYFSIKPELPVAGEDEEIIGYYEYKEDE